MQETKRCIGIDVLKIIAMLGIIGLHIIGQGGLLRAYDQGTINYYIVQIFRVMFFGAVNIFAMATGYLYVKKEKIKISSIFNLLVTVFFYCFIISTIFYLFDIANFRSSSLKEIIYSIFPILKGNYWYIICYTFLFFLIPYINKMISKLTQQELKKLLIISSVFLSIITSISLLDLFYVNSGYSVIWLIYCYLLGAYFRLYSKDTKKNKYIIFYVLLTMLTFLLNTYLIKRTGSFEYQAFILSYNSPFILTSSILFFLYVKDINIESKVFSKIAELAFGVYILHCNILIFNYILKDSFVELNLYINNPILLTITILSSLVGIYLVCALVEIVRKYIFKLFRVDVLISKIDNKLNKFIN